MKKHLLPAALLFILISAPLSAENTFALGADWSMFGAAMSKYGDGNDLISSNSAGFSCTYMSGEKWGYFIGLNLNYLGLIVTKYHDQGYSNYDISYGLFSNLTADVLAGPAYFIDVRENIKLMLGLGVHFGAPYLPNLYEGTDEDNSPTDEQNDVLLAFTVGGGMKALLRVKQFYVSLDLSWDIFMPGAPFGAESYFGGTITPAIGYVYYYPVKASE